MKLWSFVIALVMFPSVVGAQEVIVADQDKSTDSLMVAATARAQGDFEAGVKAYLAGEYESAIVSWEKAYRVWPAKIMQYNIAKALGKLGRFSEAASYAEKAKQPTKPDLVLPPQNAIQNEANLTAWLVTIESETIGRSLGSIADVPVVESRFGAIGWTGVGIAILGAGGLGAAGFFANEASKAQVEASEPIDRATYDELKNQEKENKEFGQIALYAGGGLLAVGVGLIAWDLATVETEEANVAFHIGANNVSVSASF